MNKSEFHILVIDDEEALAEVLVESFEMEDYKASANTSAYQALETLKSNRDIQLLICDMNMPGVSGLDLLKKIQEDFPRDKKPFFFLYTGNVEISKEELRGLGGHEIVSKPFNMDELVDLVETYRGRLG